MGLNGFCSLQRELNLLRYGALSVVHFQLTVNTSCDQPGFEGGKGRWSFDFGKLMTEVGSMFPVF